MAAGLTAGVTAVLGVSLATAGPAAADTGSWTAYGNTNPITSSSSKWKCGATKEVDTNVGAQACAIRSASGRSVQGAVIVRNDRSSLYGMEVAFEFRTSQAGLLLGRWECSRSGVAAHSWSVCYGATLQVSELVYVDHPGANGQTLEFGGPI
jgi:hypothetical protein